MSDKNLTEALDIVHQIPKQYNHVGMDTEFSGSVRYPKMEFMRNTDKNYQDICQNVKIFTPIQVGLVFMDKSGNTAPGVNTLQMNLFFDLE